MAVKLFRDGQLIKNDVTNSDGRLNAPLLVDEAFVIGAYRIEFAVGEYFASIQNPDARQFLDVVPIDFIVIDASSNYHVPLLVSPWAYSTYRGS